MTYVLHTDFFGLLATRSLGQSLPQPATSFFLLGCGLMGLGWLVHRLRHA
jgi:hypothetical protein